MLRCGSFSFSVERPLIMGIVNLTPDSFSGDGLGTQIDAAIAHAQSLIEAGADFLDIGAESSRPGAIPTSLSEELDRLLPVLHALEGSGVPISIDTYKPEVMRAALSHGVSMINDIYALRMPGAIEAVLESDCALCLMHMKGEPLTMQKEPIYEDVVSEVMAFLADRASALELAGVHRDRIVLDPGFGFGKTLNHNLDLLQGLDRFTAMAYPLLVGMSRKSMIGGVTGRGVESRLAGSISVALLAVLRGAMILRVHDVAETRDALALWAASGAPRLVSMPAFN